MGIISGGGKHFIIHLVMNFLTKCGIRHKVATTYHPQTSDQVKLLNGEANKILQKTQNSQ